MSIKAILIIDTVALAICVALILTLGGVLLHAMRKLAEHDIKLFGKKKQK